MASVSRDRDGRVRYLFFHEGERQVIRLGRASEVDVETVTFFVGRILAARDNNRPIDSATADWLDGLPDERYDRIARTGLVEARAKREAPTLGQLLTRFEEHGAVKATTKAARKQTTGSLRAHFGEDKRLDELTASDADEWRDELAASGLAPATVSKRVQCAKGILRCAVRWGMLDASPFADLRAGSQANAERSVYVPVEVVERVLDACPDDEWRAIVALSRFAGLRCPSEIVGLRWGDIAWDAGRMTVRSPKTAGHGEAHAARVVPLDPRLKIILLDLFHDADYGEESIFPGVRSASNLRTGLLRILAVAGVSPWPRLFHNLRASCATDWVEKAPAQSAAKWLGHSPMISAKHYLHARDAHFDLIAGGGAESGAQAAQNPAQRRKASEREESQRVSETPEKPMKMRSDALRGASERKNKMGDTGLEPVTSSMSTTRASQLRQSPI